MAKTILQSELRPLEKKLNAMAYTRDISRVFDDWLRYTIQGFSPGAAPISDWGYKLEDDKKFYEMYAEWVVLMDKQIQKKSQEKGDYGWYDAFGSLYEGCIASKGRKDNNSQFFTPETICDFMARIQGDPETEVIQGRTISDPTCGSGRTLLAFNALFPGNYLVAEDIDRTCCMMTVCNFLIHGCVGEVVWHDSLNPNSFYGAWKVNEGLNNPFSEWFGIPHIRQVEYEETCTFYAMQKHIGAKETPTIVETEPAVVVESKPTVEPTPAPKVIKKTVNQQAIQLTLF